MANINLSHLKLDFYFNNNTTSGLVSVTEAYTVMPREIFLIVKKSPHPTTYPKVLVNENMV